MNALEAANMLIEKALEKGFDEVDMLNDLGLTEVPSLLVEYTHWRNLDLSGNKISELPSAFTKLKNLKWLSLNDNPIKVFPNEFRCH